jgi:hypothetical protein
MADRMAPRVRAYDDSPYDARHTELYGATSALSASAPDGALADGAYSALYCSCSAHSLPPTAPPGAPTAKCEATATGEIEPESPAA